MTKEEREKLFNLRLQRAYYIMENKDIDPKIEKDIKQLRKEYARKGFERKGDVINDKH